MTKNKFPFFVHVKSNERQDPPLYEQFLVDPPHPRSGILVLVVQKCGGI